MLTLLLILSLTKKIRISEKCFYCQCFCIRNLMPLALLSTMPLFANAQTQTLVYEVMHNGTKYGELYASKSKEGNSTYYQVRSAINIRLILELNVEMSVKSSFNNENLMDAASIKKVNGSEKINNSISHKKNCYLMINKNGDSSFYLKPIQLTVAGMYFNEPKKSKEVFSETFLQNVPLRQVADGIYKMTLPDGNFNLYHYKNGICTEAEVHHSLMSFNFVLKSKS